MSTMRAADRHAGAATSVAGPFDGLFSLERQKTEVAVNWGIAAVVWYAIGRLIARVLVRR